MLGDLVHPRKIQGRVKFSGGCSTLSKIRDRNEVLLFHLRGHPEAHRDLEVARNGGAVAENPVVPVGEKIGEISSLHIIRRVPNKPVKQLFRE